MRWSELGDQPCSLARALSVVGDRWTLLILRDCFLGAPRFDHFDTRLGATRHVRSARLRRLVSAGVCHEPFTARTSRVKYRHAEPPFANPRHG
jgi:DNA-binding HxlR family transcriptional regulator